MKIAILSDIHANMEAFYAVIDYLRKVKIRKIMLLGDIIDYGPHSNEVIAYLNTLSLEILCNIRGNHEEYAKIAECRKLALFEYHNGFNSINRGSYRRKKMLSSSRKP